jgi:transcriptional regulator with XRE-family HTH domain
MINLKIKEIRERKNISKDYIAIQMEISIKKYDEIEKGKVDLKISELNLLGDILGVQKDVFFNML